MLAYLWGQRTRPPLFSLEWAKTWVKRIVSAPAVFASSWRQCILRSLGARLESPIFITRCKINGKRSHLHVRENTFLGRATLHLHNDVSIGKNVVVNDGAVLLTASHDVEDEDFAPTSSAIVLADHAWIATGAVILPGVTIGVGAVVGAFAVVSRSVPDFAIVVGNPARLIGRKRSKVLRYSPLHQLASVRAWRGR